MSRSIRARLDRLERRRRDARSDMLPPLFWAAICGAVPPEQLDPDTRRFIARLFEDSSKEPDPNEGSNRRAGA
jgi:hypothetical protein